MNKEKIRKALAELDVILKEEVPEDKLNMISKKFLKFIEDNKDENWTFEYDSEKDIESQDVLEETKLLLGLVYLNYWANDEEKKEVNRILDENEQKYNEQFSVDKLFTNDNLTVEETADTVENLPTPYKQSFIKRFIVFIKNIFKKGK